MHSRNLRIPLTAVVSVAAVVASTSAMSMAAANPATSPLGLAPTAVTAPKACPGVLPMASAVDGMVGTGFTVERGTTADRFTATVLGRITNGIAPGIDMIMADLTSPALTRAGGVWAGMSGSPVYAEDGRLIGAVAYGLAANSSIAGITPAGAMKSLLNDIDDPASLTKRIRVSSDGAARLARTGKVSAAEAAAGFGRLPVPVVVTGSTSPKADVFVDRLAAKLPQARVSAAGGSTSGTASPSAITSGGNFAAGLSYGTFSAVATGTTTMVCDGKAIAFGHPFFNGGAVTMSAHASTALFVQPDPLFGPFKVANAGGVVGTVDRDRVPGIRGDLGSTPATTLITSNLTRTTGQVTVGRTNGVYQPLMADIAALHTLNEVERSLGSSGGGSADLTITIRGTRANGAAFSLVRTDSFADQFSLGFAVADYVYFTVGKLLDQPFEKVKITRVMVNGTVNPAVNQYRVTSLKVKQGATYVTPGDIPVRATAGGTLATRLTLTPYQGVGSAQTVDLDVSVPAGTSGSFGELVVKAGSTSIYETPDASSFAQLLALLRGEAGNASARASLTVDNTSSGAGASLDMAVQAYERYMGVDVR